MNSLNNILNFSHTRSEIPSPKNYTDDHFHNTYEMYFFLSGDVDYVVGDSTYSLQPYDLLLIRPGVYHYPKILSDAPYERSIMNFTPDLIEEELQPVLSENRVRYCFENNKLIKRLYSALDEAKLSADKTDFRSFCRLALNMFLLQLKYAPTGNENAQIIHPTLSKILRYIDGHLQEALNASDVANRFFVSSSWIFHMFKKHLQIPYKQYVNRRKMLHAQQLVQSGTPPTQAALLCGFDEYTTFYRQYKSHYGIAPNADKDAP